MIMSSTTGEPKKSFLCCPAPFGNCCGGPKNKQKTAPATSPTNGEKSPTNNDKSPTTNDKKEVDKNCDVNSNGGGDDDLKKNPFLDDTENESDTKIRPMSNNEEAKKAPITPTWRKAGTPMASPAKVGFLVSFLVDARGGAMKGNRGSGLRLIIPAGAVDSPVRVTCRYVRRADRLLYPPPLMEREALASRILEMGPPGAEFDIPVLIEVPHFASLRDGERELVVLRSDDGETWKEHTLAYLESKWEGGDDEIYQDFVATTNLTAAYEELDTDRVVRISAKKFPHYFAILSRIREEVRAIGPEGGKITTPLAPHLQVYFPSGALQKKIKVALQVQNVPQTVLSYVWPDEDLRVSPLVALEPRRRRFHCPVQIMLYLPQFSEKKVTAKVDNVRLLCSLTGSTSKANWEDVTEDTPFCVKNNCVIFETRVSALFWAVAVDRKKGETDGQASDDDYEQFGGGEIIPKTKKKDVLELSTYLYDELVLPPYLAKIVVLYRPMTPHAWCDCLRVLCVTDDKAESAWSENKFGTSTEWEWKLVAMSEEMEISSTNQLNLILEKDGNIEIAGDCQLEFGYRQSLIFEPFQENSANLLIRAKNKRLPKNGRLTVKKSFKHVQPSKQLALCTLELDLGGGLGPGSADLLAPSPAPTNATSYSIPDLEILSLHQPPDHVSLVSHVVKWFPQSNGAIEDEDVNIIQVKEYSKEIHEDEGERTVPEKPVWY